ncbi:major facilitator superfamily domain-containing protein [Lasiosphaeria miniovina]|uniref:Major facilitator superfamily domain-containing protein n=1 Tax=Lasiosphaeria miniovina TaxID=1954250 RepID=A0AA40B6A4_9PEZI|nr:major facilitator superfamily domain-containing protein [Lasiosphaeria miniovina]KAK0728472.1 major facilitator superfamily domain-containing protein [Lasiosphaeria miniovina]
MAEKFASSHHETHGNDGVVSPSEESGNEDEDSVPDNDRASQAQRQRTTSFANTSRVVPRAKRRGLFGRFAIIPEIESPYDYTNGTKWAITAVIALAAAAAPMGSGIFYPALPQMAVDLNTTTTITNLTVAMYMLAMSIFPLWWSSFSETLGRRTIYLVSFSLFVVFSVLSAISVNISMLIIMRILGGGASASVQAVGAGTIADIWMPAERGKAMGIFYLGPLTGPLLAPIIGGALTQAFSWRATMWFLTIYGGVMVPMIFFCLPETLAKRKKLSPLPSPNAAAPPLSQLQRVTTAQPVKKAGAAFRRFFVDPLQVLVYLRYPAVLITVYSASICFCSLFVLNISISSSFDKPPYDFSTIIVGLLYLPPSLGYVVASVIGGRWIDYIMAREAKKANRYDGEGKLIFLPEDRMRENMWLAATMYPGALIWYGWSAERGLPWIVPCIANFFFGCGSMLVFGACTTMLTEFMPQRSSSGVAVNNFVRNIFSCVGGIIAQPLINAMGNGWLCTMIGLLAWTTGNLAIWALRKRGPAWRVKMDQGVPAKNR